MNTRLSTCSETDTGVSQMEYAKSVRRKIGGAMHRIIIDGNAFYEIDEECMRRKQEWTTEKQHQIEAGREKMDMGHETNATKSYGMTRSESLKYR